MLLSRYNGVYHSKALECCCPDTMGFTIPNHSSAAVQIQWGLPFQSTRVLVSRLMEFTIPKHPSAPFQVNGVHHSKAPEYTLPDYWGSPFQRTLVHPSRSMGFPIPKHSSSSFQINGVPHSKALEFTLPDQWRLPLFLRFFMA